MKVNVDYELDIDLRNAIKEVKNIILKYTINSDVYLFGSIAKGRYSRYSDIDILVLIYEKKSLKELRVIRHFFEDEIDKLNLNREVDIKLYEKNRYLELASNRCEELVDLVNRDMFYFADIDEKFIINTKDIEGLEDGVLVHCQQCIEKNLKGIITRKYGMVNREYNLVKLLEVLYIKDSPELKKYKSLCRDLKDFYFSRRYASDDYEIISKEEYQEYLEGFFELLNRLKEIRNSYITDK